MDEGALHERLRRAREACGEDVSALSRRAGIRAQHLRAIEDGRFGDLPPGIYARSAVRKFADACGLDPVAVLAEIEALLPRVDDPIDALARKCGVPSSSNGVRPSDSAAGSLSRRFAGVLRSCGSLRSASVPSAEMNPTDERAATEVHCRALAAAAVDAVLVGVLVIAVAALVALVGRVPLGALHESATPFALMGFVLGSTYFVWFGGLCGTTLGDLAVRSPLGADARDPVTLRTIAARALSAATEDARAIVRLGAWMTRPPATPAAPSRSARQPSPWLAPLRLRGRAPVLWLPANPPAGAPTPPLPRSRG
jgi:Helix-turn-helix domain